MARKTGQIIRHGARIWLVRIYIGRDPETRRRKYMGKFIYGGVAVRTGTPQSTNLCNCFPIELRIPRASPTHGVPPAEESSCEAF